MQVEKFILSRKERKQIKRNFLFHLMFCLLFAAVSQINFSQSIAVSPKDSFAKIAVPLDQVVITGQFRPQPTDKSIYKIEVLDARQIQLKAANNLADLLNNEASFRLRPEGILGDFIRIRGLTGEHVKILVDGLPVTGRMADRIDLGQLTLLNVDHVEIIEGPMSVVYGSNALAGTINIITRNSGSTDLKASIHTFYETVGTYNINGFFAKKIRNHTLGASAARNFFSGWGPVDTSRFKTWKPKLQYIAGASYMYQNNKLNINLSSDFLKEELRDQDSLSLVNLYEKALDGYHYTTRWNSRFHIQNMRSELLSWNFQMGYAYYRKRKITYLNDLVNLRKNIHENPAMHDTTAFQLVSARGSLTGFRGEKLEYQAGFDLSYESASGKRTGGYREVSDLAAFLNFLYCPLPELNLQPGIRIMHNSNYKAPLAYGVNLRYNPGLLTVRASYARGFRAPSLKQLYLSFVDNNHQIHGNENLKAETANSMNLSLEYSTTRNRNAWSLELTTFHNAIENAIQLAVNTQKPGWGQYFNVTNTVFKTRGVETVIQYRHSPDLSLSASVATTGTVRLDKPGRFAWSTDFSSTASYRIGRPGLQMALFYKYSDNYLEFAGNYDDQERLSGIAQLSVKGYHTLDVTLFKEFLKGKLNLSAGLKNIFNVTTIKATGTINIHGSSNEGIAAGYGRTFFLVLQYTFDKR